MISAGSGVLFYRKWVLKIESQKLTIVRRRKAADGEMAPLTTPWFRFLIKADSRAVLKDPAGDTMMTAINWGQLSVSD